MAQQVSTFSTNSGRVAEPAWPSAERRYGPVPAWAALRVLLGLVFLWAFVDKMFALGYSTGAKPNGTIDRFGSAAWIHGGSPTKGFLSFGTSGPLADTYKSLAGNVVVDWLFMLALLGVGLALVLGVALRPAAVVGVLLLLLIRLAIWMPQNNPLIDEHLIYIILLACMPIVGAGDMWGLGGRWRSLPIVERYPVLA